MFERTGQVVTRTYKKPNCMPQYLPFFSEHAFSCKSSIYKGEVTRHLINCSSPSDYDMSLSDLRNDLLTRGYPPPLLQHVPYDREKREKIISNLGKRNRLAPNIQRSSDMIVFKCPYGKHIRPLNINRECNRLLSTLRVHLGTAFLQDVRTTIAHPNKVNLFVKTFRYNFLPNVSGEKRGG